ncbi:MAG TPA: hypothetical protein VEA58_07200 [Anaerovoracaceae bacterium]|nr:hypothetical protein [Anaerovoracaceae bacterium]
MVNVKSIGEVEGIYLNGALPMDELQYHTSWDWLMPVVEKIRSTGIAKPLGAGVISLQQQLDAALLSCKMEAVWQAVTKFIQWYNNQKTTNQ